MTLVGICDSQPATAEGVRSLLAQSKEFDFCWSARNLLGVLHRLSERPIDVLVIDKGFGVQSVMDLVQEMRSNGLKCATVVWGVAINEPEALRMLQSGVRGLLRKSSDLPTIFACLRTVSNGGTWVDESILRNPGNAFENRSDGLTQREREVLELVTQGLRNKEIAGHLGIQPGTVKIHLRHIFEKTGVHGRFGLALDGLRRAGRLRSLEDSELALAGQD